MPELLLAGRERPFWTWYARRQMWDPSALAEEDIDEIVHSAEQPGGTRAILEMYRARQTDAEQNRPHYADPIGAPSGGGEPQGQQVPEIPDPGGGGRLPAGQRQPGVIAQARHEFLP